MSNGLEYMIELRQVTEQLTIKHMASSSSQTTFRPLHFGYALYVELRTTQPARFSCFCFYFLLFFIFMVDIKGEASCHTITK